MNVDVLLRFLTNLIEQLQYQSESKGSTFTLNFNHPVKELVWAGARSTTASVHGGPSTPTGLVLDDGTKLRESDTSTGGTVTLKLNGHERFAPRHDNYFTRTQVWQHHNALGDTDQGDAIHVYSFALKPEEHQPSGTCNFSRIDNDSLFTPRQLVVLLLEALTTVVSTSMPSTTMSSVSCLVWVA